MSGLALLPFLALTLGASAEETWIERMEIEFRAEAFNFSNTPLFRQLGLKVLF